MARPRPTEVRKIASLLLEEAPDAETLAETIIQELDAMRADREFYVVATAVGGMAWGYGPWSTANQAAKAIERGIGRGIDGARVGPIRVYPATHAEGLLAPSGPAGGCKRCGHPRAAHSFPRSKVGGCVVGLPVKGKKTPAGAPPRCDCEEWVA